MSAARSRKRWIEEREIREDFRLLARQLKGFAGTSDSSPAVGKKVLFISMAGEAYQFKVEAAMAKALQSSGCRVSAVVSRADVNNVACFKLFGINDFVYFEDYHDASRARRLLAGMPPSALEPPYSFDRLMGLTVQGVHIGQHVLSTFLSSTQKSRAAFDSPEVVQFIRLALRSALDQIPAAEGLLDEAQPDIVVFLEKGYLPNAVFFDLALARELSVVQWCGAQETNAYVLKKYGSANRKAHPFSLDPSTWTQVLRMPWTEDMDREFSAMIQERYEKDTWYNRNRLRSPVTHRSPEDVRRLLALDPAKKTAVVFSHILWDATFFYGENLFEDYEKWLLATVRAACRNPALNWVIKLHPDYVWKLQRGGGKLEEPDLLTETFGQLPSHVRLMLPETDINTYSLFSVADFCVTVRGTIGIEMACFGVPVLTAGTGRYSNHGFTTDSASPEEFLERLAALPNLPRMTQEQIIKARKFAYVLFKLRPFKFLSFTSVLDATKDVKHPLHFNYHYHFNSLDEFKAADDLRGFAAWVTQERAVDYLKPLPVPAAVPL